MKRIKAMNGYTVAQYTRRDGDGCGHAVGEYAVFLSADYNEFGADYSTPEFDGIETIDECMEIIAGCGNFGKAYSDLSAKYTAVSFDEVEERVAEMDSLDEMKAELERVNASNRRSAWGRGVGEYAVHMLENLADDINHGWHDFPTTEKQLMAILLNGAHDWHEFSWGGCSLIYNREIAELLCNASELKKTNNGQRKPNATEEWLDVQARALYQASLRIVEAWKATIKK